MTMVLLVGAPAALANTQVSSDPFTNTTSFHATEVEPDTFASGSTFVSTFQAGRFSDGGASNIGWATTTDAGTTYTAGFLPGTTTFATPARPYARISDPVVAFDAKHGAWLISTLALDSSLNGAAMLVNRSTDGAAAFGAPVTVAAAAAGQNLDKDWIACDNTAASSFYGNCYAEWDDFGSSNRLHMAVSSDGGLTWTESTVPAASVIGGQPLVQPNGTVVMPIDNAFETAVGSFVSTDGGSSFRGPFKVAGIRSHIDAGNLRSGPLPSAEIDGAGKVYVAWEDCRFIRRCSANDIVYSTSSNGVKWSAIKRVPIDPTKSGVDHFLPGFGVDPSTSGATARLGLTYYYYPSTTCTTATCQLDVGFISSSNGGSTWSAPTQLAGPTSLSQLPLTSQGYMVGDYISSSFVSSGALSVFAVGFPVTGKTCTFGDPTSCNEPMEAPSSPLSVSRLAATRAPATGPIESTSSDHREPTKPVKVR